MLEKVDEELVALVADAAAETPEDVAEPVRRAVLSPGKRIRPILLLGGYRAVGGEWADATLLSCSVELVHAYSLVHDDLPCMDDDVLRRGRPTLHVEFGVAAATLAGAVLMPLAVRTICRSGDRMGLSRERVRQIECQAKERMRRAFLKKRRFRPGSRPVAERPRRSPEGDSVLAG